jgi:hypothetical protein
MGEISTEDLNGLICSPYTIPVNQTKVGRACIRYGRYDKCKQGFGRENGKETTRKCMEEYN